MPRSIMVRAALFAAVLCVLLVPAGAGAATVVNGDFETGDLSGWQVFNSTKLGNWFAYTGTKTPLNETEFIAPPQGNWAAVTDEDEPDTAILFQDVALEPFFAHQLSMTLYYVSFDPIAVPEPNTLVLGGAANQQQLRVDVVRPTAPIESLAPGDILTTVFANKNGDPETMAPTRFTADLTPFAGQTVRLRIANAVQEDLFDAGVDAVSIASTPPSNAFSRGKLALNKKKGTGSLAINVPGPGILQAVAKGKRTLVKGTSLTTTAAGTANLALKPTGFGLKALKNKGKLKAGINVTFTPTGGSPATQAFKVTLRKTLKPKAR